MFRSRTGKAYDDLSETFAEYNQVAAQILMTKNTMVNNLNRHNARNTFEELLNVGAIPVVNENDSISSYELEKLESFGDNDTLSAVIAGLIGADLLILLSDIDGLFTDDPNAIRMQSSSIRLRNWMKKLLSMGKVQRAKSEPAEWQRNLLLPRLLHLRAQT